MVSKLPSDSHTYDSSAKCLITGEHSVLFGAPALCVPVPLITKSQVFYRDDRLIYDLHFDDPCLDPIELQYSDLMEFKAAKHHLYNLYRTGHSTIDKVLSEPRDLSVLTLAFLVESLTIKRGMSIRLSSQIPMGAGLGSSAALITSILKHSPLNTERLFSLSKDIESYQHGYSSGLDVATSLSSDKVVVSQNSSLMYKPYSGDFWKRYTLVYTGQAESSTGQCVDHTRKVLSENTELLARLTRINKKVVDIFFDKNWDLLPALVQENQNLLEKIGVVPNKVRTFVQRLNREGVCAKVCGAGSISGDNAGLVWILSNHQNIQDIIARFGYQCISLSENRTEQYA